MWAPIISTLLSLSFITTCGATTSIDVRIASDVLPTEIHLEDQLLRKFPLVRQGEEALFKGTLDELIREAVVTDFDVVGRWGDDLVGISLRIWSAVQNHDPPPVLIFLPKPISEKSTIDTFANRGLDGELAFRTYYEARTVYQDMMTKSSTHQVTVGAAYWWFAASYQLARRTDGLIRVDPRAIQAVERLVYAEDNTTLAHAMKRLKINRTSLREDVNQAKMITWMNFRLVKEYSAKRKFELAKIINDYYIKQYDDLTEPERRILLKKQGVDRSLLETNALYLDSRIGISPN